LTFGGGKVNKFCSTKLHKTSLTKGGAVFFKKADLTEVVHAIGGGDSDLAQGWRERTLESAGKKGAQKGNSITVRGKDLLHYFSKTLDKEGGM